MNRSRRTPHTRCMLRAVACAALLPALLAGRAAPAAGDNAGVDPKALTAIVTAADPHPLVQQAAKHLRGYLGRMYKVRLPIEARADITPRTTNVVLVGEKAVRAAGAITAEELKAVRWDGFVLKAGGGRVALAGPRPRATLFAVSGLLEHLGCRFCHPAEIVPTLEGKPIGPFDVSDKPTFEFRRISAVYPWKMRTSSNDLADPCKGANPELFTKKAGSDLWIDHTAAYLVPRELYYDEHPEFYAMRANGQRIAKDKFSHKRTPLCLSNPQMIQVCIERLNAWIENQPECRFFMVSYGDTHFHCQCPECKKLDPKPGQYADRTLHWVNAIARAVGKKHPDKVFLTYAYLNTQKPPQRLKPEPNVIVLYTPWWGQSTMCRHHPYFWCNRSIVGAAEMEGWFKAAPHNLGVYDYSIGWQLKMRGYEAKLKWWAKRGYRAFFELGNPKEFRNIENYVKARLAWDASLDPAKLQLEYCQAVYGPAGKHVSDVIDLKYHYYVDPGDHKFGSPRWMSEGLELLEKAYAAVKGTKYEKRFTGDKDLYDRLVKYRAAAAQPAKEAKPKAKPKDTLDRSKLWLAKPRISRKGVKDEWKLTELRAIRTLGNTDIDQQVAGRLQALIAELYGIRLPVNPDAAAIDAQTTGVILVGRTAALASALVSEDDFKAAGAGGVVIRGRDGRVAFAATKDANLPRTIDAWMYILRHRHGPVPQGQSLKIGRPVIGEFTLIDWPPFGAVYPAPRP